MTDLQIVSDLHLEKPAAYDVFEILPKAPYLALLGDIGVITDEGFFPFIEKQLEQFRIVLFLLGNHEPYHNTWEETKECVHNFSISIDDRRSRDESLGSFVFLDQTRYDLSSDITILGCTLFSKVAEEHSEKVSFGLNDFYYIKDWTVENHSAAHEEDLKWLNGQVERITTEEPQRTIIIFTHHSPLGGDERASDPRHVNSPLSSGFATDLSREECWKNPRVALWAYGHTHYNVELVDDTTSKKVVSNQRGYYFSQAKGFDVGKVVQISRIPI
ncbi:hypothetical protein N7478_003851 [Penicillium angulare]|uniref:uncharacterized protein n=1 Tax=Penicillium angulare TaxID=116970 RepID=UPI00254049EE|nr:uncharacterized protein N7478_003851 [Penicillium angulare]KAJ5288165.1 hypothetical protein N7478_003851 [Penicillium angulare]